MIIAYVLNGKSIVKHYDSLDDFAQQDREMYIWMLRNGRIY